MAQPLTVLFMPESAYGPTNNCIGIGDVLPQARPPRRLRRRGVVEGPARAARLRRGPRRPRPAARRPTPPEQDAGQFWKDFIRDTAPEFRKPTIEQLATFMQPTWQALIDGARYCEPQLREIIARQRPDVIVEDNVVSFPALMTAGRAVRPDRVVQPARDARRRTSRRPTPACPSDDRSEWAAFREEYDRTHRATWAAFDDVVPRAGRAGAAGPRVHPHLATR